MANKSYQVLSFAVPMKHSIMADVWHFEYPDTLPLVNDMERTLNQLSSEGWKVISTQTLLRGEYGVLTQYPPGEEGVGYSVTDCLIVILEKDVFDS